VPAEVPRRISPGGQGAALHRLHLDRDRGQGRIRRPAARRQGGTAEAFDAWRKGRDNFGEELADVAIYLLSLAEMTGVDLQDEIETKMAENAARVYQRLPNGVLAKSSGEAD
jgi:predicted ArsR family transcriptional regulator